MAGFFKKVVSAFVEVEEGASGGTGGGRSSVNLDEITSGTSELLAQLEGIQAGESGAPPPSFDDDRTAGPPRSIDAGSVDLSASPGRLASAALAGTGDAPAPPSGPSSPLMGMTAERVFQQAGILDGPNSASRVLKIIAGLSMFPAEQQIVMVRAMDAADETWSEAEVLADGRARQAALRSHLRALQTERDTRVQDIDARIAGTKEEGQQILAEIDRRIEQLQKQRATAIADTTSAVDHLEREKHDVEQQSEKARHGITHVINALSSLLTFFAGGSTAPPAE